jgi:hypothetical protein
VRRSRNLRFQELQRLTKQFQIATHRRRGGSEERAERTSLREHAPETNEACGDVAAASWDCSRFGGVQLELHTSLSLGVDGLVPSSWCLCTHLSGGIGGYSSTLGLCAQRSRLLVEATLPFSRCAQHQLPVVCETDSSEFGRLLTVTPRTVVSRCCAAAGEENGRLGTDGGGTCRRRVLIL